MTPSKRSSSKRRVRDIHLERAPLLQGDRSSSIGHLVPNRSDVFKSIGIALSWVIATQLLGTLLTAGGAVPLPWMVLVLAAVVSFGLPLLASPCPFRSRLNALLLWHVLFLAVLVPSALTPFERHGDWMLDWLSREEGHYMAFMMGEGAHALAAEVEGAAATLVGRRSSRSAASGRRVGRAGKKARGASSPAGNVSPRGGSAGGSDWRSRIRRELARTPSAERIAAMEKEILIEINRARREAGLTPWIIDPAYSETARSRSRVLMAHPADGPAHLRDAPGGGPLEEGDASAEVLELYGHVKGYAHQARDLVRGWLQVGPDREKLIGAQAYAFGRMGAGMACTGPDCYAVVLIVPKAPRSGATPGSR